MWLLVEVKKVKRRRLKRWKRIQCFVIWITCVSSVWWCCIIEWLCSGRNGSFVTRSQYSTHPHWKEASTLPRKCPQQYTVDSPCMSLERCALYKIYKFHSIRGNCSLVTSPHPFTRKSVCAESAVLFSCKLAYAAGCSYHESILRLEMSGFYDELIFSWLCCSY